MDFFVVLAMGDALTNLQLRLLICELPIACMLHEHGAFNTRDARKVS